jgi:phosphoribosyl-ATP pyrophosphohydrolase
VDSQSKFCIEELYVIISDRRDNPSPGSYTASLISQGEDQILKKLGEESVEVILAASSQGDQRLIEEVADLFYHTLVLLASRGIDLDDIYAELHRRHRPA